MRAHAIYLVKGGEERMGVFRKCETWYIDYRVHGKRRREKIGPSKELAKRVLNKRLVAIAEGKFLDVKREKRCRFSEAAERFLEYSETNKRSYLRDRTIVNRHLLPIFGKKHLDEITSWDVERYKASRKDKLSPASVNRELSCLKTIFNKAIHWRLTKENPVRGVKMFRENNRRLRFLMPDEIRDLLDCCAPFLRPIVATALHTGMRRGEILNLTWQDIDFDRGHITIRDSKNGESRTAPMNDLLAETLRRHKEERRPKNPLVFPSPTGKPYSDFRQSFKVACKEAGITDFRFHDLRHTFASHLVMNGVDLTTVKELLGHKTLVMTLRYAHLSQGHKKEAVNKLGTVLGGHYLDTKAKPMASALDTSEPQVLDKVGAGSGDRTHTSTRLKGF
jgi:integrase